MRLRRLFNQKIISLNTLSKTNIIIIKSIKDGQKYNKKTLISKICN